MAMRKNILKDAVAIIFKNPRIFTFISLVLILPTVCVQVSISALMIKLTKPPIPLDIHRHLLEHRCFTEIITILIFSLLLTLLINLISSVLCCSSLFYTTSHLYQTPNKEITKKEALNLSPSVWTRLFITTLWSLTIQFLVSVYIFGTYYIYKNIMKEVAYLMFFLSLLFLIYFSLVLMLASVISVLEDLRGIKALKEGDRLLRGSIFVGICLMGLQVILQMPQQQLLMRVMKGIAFGGFKWWELVFGIVAMVSGVVFWNVVYVMYYYSCKACHGEDVMQQYVAVKTVGDEAI